MNRTAIIVVNYGPYHMAWARSLAEVSDIEPWFIELTSEQVKYPWKTDRDSDQLNFRTLVKGAYEQTSFRQMYRKLTGVLQELNPKAVVVPSYSPPIMLAAAHWAKKNGSASIIISASTPWDYERVWWRERLKRFLVRKYYDSGFVGGRASRNYLRSLGMPDEYIWGQHDAVDNEYFRSIGEQVLRNATAYRESAGLPERYFLYVGRFSPEKNLSRLLEAYRMYREANPKGWKLVLVGEGPQGKELRQIAGNLRLTDIVWPGFRQINELPIYYALADAFILPSVREPWGLVVNEAMASGLPVLVSERCGSAWDLVAKSNGYTFDPYDVSEIAERMLDLSQKSEAEREAMGKASQRIVSGYSLELRTASLADCIRQTTKRIAGEQDASSKVH